MLPIRHFVIRDNAFASPLTMSSHKYNFDSVASFLGIPTFILTSFLSGRMVRELLKHLKNVSFSRSLQTSNASQSERFGIGWTLRLFVSQ